MHYCTNFSSQVTISGIIIITNHKIQSQYKIKLSMIGSPSSHFYKILNSKLDSCKHLKAIC